MATTTARGRVLLADDEILVRDLVQDALEDAGYEVLACSTGLEALAALGRDTRFDGLVTDINFGGPPVGWEVANRAREIAPTIAVVYMTGDSAHQWNAHGVARSSVIAKPFVPSQVTAALAAQLDTSDGRA